MGEGLFFWLILIAVAVLQGIGQKKRKPGTPGQRLPDSEPRGREAPAGDRPRQIGPDQGGIDVSSDEGSSSESMIPSDVWEEILGLARGTPRQSTARGAPSKEMEEPLPVEIGGRTQGETWERAPMELKPRRAPPPPVVSQPDYTPTARKFPSSHGADAVLHATRASESESRLGVRRQSEGQRVERRAASVRAELFGAGTLKELRKAIVHQEVLGRPVSLREDS